MKIHSRTRKKKASHFQTLDSIQTLILSVFKYLPATLPCYCSVPHRGKFDISGTEQFECKLKFNPHMETAKLVLYQLKQ